MPRAFRSNLADFAKIQEKIKMQSVSRPRVRSAQLAVGRCGHHAVSMSYNANQERGQEQRHIAFLAIGTRGDVQPLAILAATLARRSSRVTFVTNASVRRFVQPQLNASGVRHIEFLTLPSMTRMGAEPTVSEEDHREECVRALETTFGKTGTDVKAFWSSTFSHWRGSISQRRSEFHARL